MDIELVVNNQNTCIINGSLTRGVMNKIITLGDKFIMEAEAPVIDLQGIIACDSAGVALLVYWWRLAQKNNKKIVFRGLSKDMTSIMQVSHVDDILTT